MAAEQVDVFISGAGPVGLMLAYQLARLGNSVHIIDAANKASPQFPMYGRACTLYPRTLEMLDQIDLFDEMSQIGFCGRRAVTFKDGQRVQGRGWNQFEHLEDTMFDFLLNIRLKYSEDVFRGRLKDLGVRLNAPVKLVGMELDEKCKDDYKVTATCENVDGQSYKVRSKYIIGCDGGSSAVRKFADIPLIGAEKEDHWVRIDGVVETNMPDARCGFGALESATHGQVLFVALDHSASRIGYALTNEMYAKYGKNMSKEDAIREAKAAMAPFDLEFKQVDWHTVYVVKQFLASTLQNRERILLAGDAAHAHSSGSAQGMNTGTHDAVSLGWRLAGVLNGLYKPEVLATYSVERRASAQTLINNDKIIADLISGHRPEKYKNRPEGVYELLDEFFKSTMPFTLGLGISYEANLVNDVENSEPLICAAPGHRGPDALIHKQGFKRLPLRLFEVTKNKGRFHVIIWTGDIHKTRSLLKTLRKQVDQHSAKFDHAIAFRTIVLGSSNAFDEYLGVRHFGDGYWDVDHSAHTRYQVSLEVGAIAVLRPDGIIGFVAPLDGFDKVAAYLGRLVVPQQKAPAENGVNGHVGQAIVPDENNLYYQQAKEQGLPVSMESGAPIASR